MKFENPAHINQMASIDGWSITDLTKIEPRFIIIFDHLVTGMMREMKDNRKAVHTLLTEIVNTTIQKLTGFELRESELVLELIMIRHEYPGVMSNVTLGMLHDPRFAGDSEVTRRLKVKKILIGLVDKLVGDLLA